ncbi:TIGR03668 family PPOX class F420-dependent oxidoreductase [Marinactinospora endophytica]
MRLTPHDARERFAASRVARLATADGRGRPHLVPVTFAVRGDTVAIGIDHKPKSGHNLKRLANIAENPLVCLLADEYDEGWERLWWARADGRARVVRDGRPWTEARSRLIARYRQYRDIPPEGPMILVDVLRWSGWSFT